MLSPSRQKTLLAGLTSIAQKVYAVVPIAESWTQAQIAAEVNRQSMCMTHRVVSGCLSAIVAAGLASESTPGSYRRVGVRRAPAEKQVAPQVSTHPQENAPMKPTTLTVAPPPAAPAPAPAPAPTASPIDKLGLLAARVAKIAADLAEVSAAVNDAAVEAQEQMESGAEDSQKLRQLQAILKSVA